MNGPVRRAKNRVIVSGHLRQNVLATVPSPAIPVSSRPGPLAVGIGCGALLGLIRVTGGLLFDGLVAFRNGPKQFLFRWDAIELPSQKCLDRRNLEGVILSGQADRGAFGTGAPGARCSTT